MTDSLWSKTIGLFTVHIVPDSFAENPYDAWNQASERMRPNYFEALEYREGHEYAEYLNSQGYIADSLSTQYQEYTFAISREKALSEFGDEKTFTKLKNWSGVGLMPLPIHVYNKAKKCLECEIEAFRQWCEGETYGVIISAPHPDTGDETIIDSCFGFYGWDDTKTEALNMLEYAAK